MELNTLTVSDFVFTLFTSGANISAFARNSRVTDPCSRLANRLVVFLVGDRVKTIKTSRLLKTRLRSESNPLNVSSLAFFLFCDREFVQSALCTRHQETPRLRIKRGFFIVKLMYDTTNFYLSLIFDRFFSGNRVIRCVRLNLISSGSLLPTSLKRLSLPRGTWLLEAHERKLLLSSDGSLTSRCFYAAIRQTTRGHFAKERRNLVAMLMPGRSVKDHQAF